MTATPVKEKEIGLNNLPLEQVRYGQYTHMYLRASRGITRLRYDSNDLHDCQDLSRFSGMNRIAPPFITLRLSVPEAIELKGSYYFQRNFPGSGFTANQAQLLGNQRIHDLIKKI
jgi:hypothetical protein